MVRWCINKNWVSSWSTGSALTSLTVHSPHRPPHFWVLREQAVLVFHALILFPLAAWIIHLNATEGNQATLATVKQQRLRKESRPLLCIDFPIEWIASMLFWCAVIIMPFPPVCGFLIWNRPTRWNSHRKTPECTCCFTLAATMRENSKFLLSF